MDPKEKTVITTCKEITILKFDWNGPREVVNERILWETNVVMKLGWSAVNGPQAMTFRAGLLNTNGQSTNFTTIDLGGRLLYRHENPELWEKHIAKLRLPRERVSKDAPVVVPYSEYKVLK